MAGFEAASGDFGEHGGEKKRIRVAHQNDRDGAVTLELLLQALRGTHSGETATEYHDPFLFLLRGRFHLLLWTEDSLSAVGQSLDDQTQRSAIQHLPDERGKIRAHMFGAPLRHLSGKERNCDYADQAP